MPEFDITVVQAIGARKQGGAETFYVRFVEALKHSDRVTVVPLVAKDSWIAQRLAALHIDYETAPFRKWFDWQTGGRMSQLVRQHPNALVQSWMGRASSLVPRLDVPVVARLGGPYQMKYFENCDHLVVNAPNLMDHVLNNHWPKDRVSLIPNFVVEADAPRDDVRQSERTSLGLSDGDVLLSVFGRLHVNKAFDIAIKALAELPSHVHLQIVGVGPLEGELKTLAGKLNLTKRVHFRGWADDVAPLFAATDVCLVPSRHEPFGNVVPEAWYNKTPVIASTSLGPASIITDGVDGLLFPIDDAPALSDRVLRLLSAPTLQADLVAKAFCEYESRFAKVKIIDLYCDLYRDLLSRTVSDGGGH